MRFLMTTTAGDPPDEQMMADMGKFVAELSQAGVLLATGGLDQGSRVTAKDGQITVTDGPFAEAKEHLAGFFLVDCESMDRAVEIAGLVPEAAFGLVEVRPVLELGGPDS